jgi:hypothetical protein
MEENGRQRCGKCRGEAAPEQNERNRRGDRRGVLWRVKLAVIVDVVTSDEEQTLHSRHTLWQLVLGMSVRFDWMI